MNHDLKHRFTRAFALFACSCKCWNKSATCSLQAYTGITFFMFVNGFEGSFRVIYE